MKIAIIVSDPASGLLFYPIQLAISFKAMGHYVIALSWTQKGQNEGLHELLIKHDIPLRHVKALGHTSSLITLLYGLARKRPVSLEQFELLISFGPLSAWQLRNCINKNGKVISMIEAMGHDGKHYWKARTGALLLNKYSNKVVALCHLERERLESLGVDPTKIEIIFNPIDIEQFLSIANKMLFVGRKTFLEQLGLNAKRKIIACLASFQPRKRQDILIKSFANICCDYPEYDVVFAGDGPELNICKQIANSLGLGTRIDFIGKLTNNNAIGLLASADVVAHCSNAETFGYSMVEPLLLEKPTIVTRIGIGWELEQENAAEVVPPDDINAFTKGLQRVLKGGAEIEGRWPRGKLFVKEHCSVEKIAQQLVNLSI